MGSDCSMGTWAKLGHSSNAVSMGAKVVLSFGAEDLDLAPERVDLPTDSAMRQTLWSYALRVGVLSGEGQLDPATQSQRDTDQQRSGAERSHDEPFHHSRRSGSHDTQPFGSG